LFPSAEGKECVCGVLISGAQSKKAAHRHQKPGRIGTGKEEEEGRSGKQEKKRDNLEDYKQ
jgi:hypothetical protein